ncbi:hypothetical protein DSM106972_077410 [Dulcicalothrix desertica PCC 7102]|uniref:Uncharacterized protein n=1 Tax=Dulcicalothrix desertica PCC 7102 TaxID=232991 RepID=A0A433UZL7_9CYAN|nr:hypothetical protein [Dulcicalothrix desertica]RUS99299.1 hypothetical protein DSM106972_077410 [Dulcicalothrix desertica PCC 7102]TWH49965.1 hypothetical protein CAL7102_04237 [Dulcicalothrix desertica PCC 7102]
MSKLYELLEKIKLHTWNVFRYSLNNFPKNVLGSYQFARREMGLENQDSEGDFYKNFQPWLQQKLEVKTVNSWDKIILLYSVDEKEGITYFFQLLDEFLKRDKTLEN